MTWAQYIFKHLIPTWFFSFRSNFRIWADLVTENYDGYALLEDDDPEEECRNWFWVGLNESDTYSKEFLEYLQKLVDDVDSGKVKTYTFEEITELFKLEEDNGPL